MRISLTPEQEARITARVTSGQFASVEEAVCQFIDQGLAGIEDDMAWANPYVDEAAAAVARGEVSTRAQHRARIDAHLARLKE